MQLLVTRPDPEARDTAARLTERGHAALVQPLTRIEILPPPPPAAMPAAIVFTSRNGVRAASLWREAPAWRDVPVFAVGASTAATVRDTGFLKVRAGEGDVAALAALVREALDPAAGTILYPAARDRAGDLEGLLSDAGFKVRLVEAYRAVAAESLDREILAAFGKRSIDGVLFHSRRSASVFGDLAGKAGIFDALGGTMLLALSERVAEPLRAIGGASVRIALRPEEAALLDLVPPPGQRWPGTESPV